MIGCSRPHQTEQEIIKIKVREGEKVDEREGREGEKVDERGGRRLMMLKKQFPLANLHDPVTPYWISP